MPRQNKGSSLARVNYWRGWARLNGADLHFAVGDTVRGRLAKMMRARNGVGRPPLVTWARWQKDERTWRAQLEAAHGGLGDA